MITEEDIDAAVAELEEGISEEEREKKIKKLDKEIDGLSERLKKGV